MNAGPDLDPVPQFAPILNALATAGVTASLISNGGDVAITARCGSRYILVTDPHGGVALDPD